MHVDSGGYCVDWKGNNVHCCDFCEVLRNHVKFGVCTSLLLASLEKISEKNLLPSSLSKLFCLLLATSVIFNAATQYVQQCYTCVGGPFHFVGCQVSFPTSDSALYLLQIVSIKRHPSCLASVVCSPSCPLPPSFHSFQPVFPVLFAAVLFAECLSVSLHSPTHANLGSPNLVVCILRHTFHHHAPSLSDLPLLIAGEIHQIVGGISQILGYSDVYGNHDNYLYTSIFSPVLNPRKIPDIVIIH